MQLIKSLRRALHPIKSAVIKSPLAFLEQVTGVIHIGANVGQERDLYERFDFNVLWVEPIPEVFLQLKKNLQGFPRQRACQYLVTDKDNETYSFNISSNNGESSSILDINMHKDIWPEVGYSRKIDIQSITLRSLMDKERIPLNMYNALIMDTQGSELLVLKGTGDLLRSFKFIKTEVSDFESYKNCCKVEDIELYLKQFGFSEYHRNKFAAHPDGGGYFDIIYKRGFF
jgi:FkbM family methyltransferase